MSLKWVITIAADASMARKVDTRGLFLKSFFLRAPSSDTWDYAHGGGRGKQVGHICCDTDTKKPHIVFDLKRAGLVQHASDGGCKAAVREDQSSQIICALTTGKNISGKQWSSILSLNERNA